MQVRVRCPSCFSMLTVEHTWPSIRCGCGRQFDMPAAVGSAVLPTGYERAATGLCVRVPSLWSRMSGQPCPSCGRRGYVADGGIEMTGQRVGHRREVATERFHGPYGFGFERARSYREVVVPTTVREYARFFGCSWCGYVWTQAEQVEV